MYSCIWVYIHAITRPKPTVNKLRIIWGALLPSLRIALKGRKSMPAPLVQDSMEGQLDGVKAYKLVGRQASHRPFYARLALAA